ncbi:transposase [Burkholderia pseudomallei]|nr:transposase [Burkholderia pseudomallei]CAJ6356269.1 transposase [Burkholderia pseudomallei]CAJ9006060.1 transposase [Burkholderia pseudomallei]
MLTQQAYDLMPRVKITDLLFEVDQRTNFTHLKSDAEPPDRTLLLTGDYVWHANKRVAKGRFRPLRHRKSAGPPWRTKKSVS